MESFENSNNKAVPDWRLQDRQKGHDLWTELKVEKDGERVEFQTGQVQWLENHIKCGGLAIVVLLRKDHTVETYHARSARWLSNTRKLGLGERAIYRFPLGGSQTVWGSFGNFLIGELRDNWPSS
jgi:hypothetical protein